MNRLPTCSLPSSVASPIVIIAFQAPERLLSLPVRSEREGERGPKFLSFSPLFP